MIQRKLIFLIKLLVERKTIEKSLPIELSFLKQFKVISEGDIYRLAIKSKLPNAEKFETWIFDEVLPSIRQNGGYIFGQEELSEQELMAKALMVAQKTIERRKESIRGNFILYKFFNRAKLHILKIYSKEKHINSGYIANI